MPNWNAIERSVLPMPHRNEFRLQIDTRPHVEHRSGFGEDLFALPQRDLECLHDVADQFVFHVLIGPEG